MKHNDMSFIRRLDSGAESFANDDTTIILVKISRYRDDDAISRIKSALPGSDVVNLTPLYNSKIPAANSISPEAALSPLTNRQQEILDYLLTGLSNKEIGRKLGLSHFTVRNHVSNILRILNFQCRREMRRSLDVDRTAPARALTA